MIVSPESVDVGENVTITATVENTGNTTENVTIVFKINGEEVKSANFHSISKRMKMQELVRILYISVDYTIQGITKTFVTRYR